MSELRKIADRMREASEELCEHHAEQINDLGKQLFIDAREIDALAAQEPVAWRYRMIGDRWWNFDDSTDLDTGEIEGGEIEPLYAAPPAQSGEVEAWRFVDKDGQPEPGCYVAIYEENGSLPVSLCHYGEWEFYDADGDDERADDEGNVRGFGWSENAEDRGGDGYVHLRNVVAYLPTSYTYKDETMQKVRALLARRVAT